MEERFPNWVATKQNIESFDFKAATGTQISYRAGCAIGDDPQAILGHCSFGDANSSNRFLVLGDSHTAAWYPAFQAAAERKHSQGILVTLPGCPPLFGISSFDGAKNICAEGFDKRIGALIATKQIRKVFLVAFWSMYEGDPNNQPDHFISDAQTSSHDSASSKLVIARRLEDTLRRFQNNGIEVVIVHSVPILPKDIQALPDDYTQPIANIHLQNQFMSNFIKLHQRAGLGSIDPTPVFCDTLLCRARIDDNVLYTDNNHISPAGAVRVIKLIEDAL